MSDVPSAAPAAPSTPAPSASSSSAPSTPAPAAPKAEAAPTPASPATPGQAAPAGETAAERKARLLKLKVDGVEEEVNLDEMPDEDLATQLQLAKAARKRMQEAADVRRKFQQLVEMGKERPDEAFEALFGKNFKETAEEYLRQKYAEEELPEAEKEKLALQRQLAEERARREAFENAEREKKIAEIQQQQFQQFETEYRSALTKHDLPFTKETAYLMAQVGMLNLQHGIDLTADQMATEVKKRLTGMTQGVFKQLKGAALLSYLGDDVVKEVVRMSVERVRGAKAAPKPFEPPAPAPTEFKDDLDEAPQAKRQRVSVNAWRKFARE